MATIYERVQALEDWKADITAKFQLLKAFAIEHRQLYDKFKAEKENQEAINARAEEVSKRKERRRNRRLI